MNHTGMRRRGQHVHTGDPSHPQPQLPPRQGMGFGGTRRDRLSPLGTTHYSAKRMEELHVTNKPKLSQNDRGPHPQRDYVPPPCVQRESRDRGSLPGSVTLLVCQDRCAALSQIPGGWLGFPSTPQQRLQCYCHMRPNFLPRALYAMLHLGQMFRSVCLLVPAKNTTTIIYLSFQHM